MRAIARFALLAVAAVVCGWALVRFAYQPLQCNREITRLTLRTTVTEQSAGDYERLVRARRNVEELTAMRDRCGLDIRLYMLKGSNEETLGRYDDALQTYRDALVADQRPEIYAAIGNTLIQLGRIDEAVENYATAARFNPHVYERMPSEEILRRVRERVDGHS